MSDDLKQPDTRVFVDSITTGGTVMTDDLKARLEKYHRGEQFQPPRAADDLIEISPPLAAMLNACLKRIEELEQIIWKLRTDLDAAETTIQEMCGASEGSYLSRLRDSYFQGKVSHEEV